MSLKKHRAAKPERFAKTRTYVGFDLASSPARTVRYELDQGGHVTSCHEIPVLGPIASGKTHQQFREIYRQLPVPKSLIPFRWRFRMWRRNFWRNFRIRMIELRKGRRLADWERELVELLILQRRARRGDAMAMLLIAQKKFFVYGFRELDRIIPLPT